MLVRVLRLVGDTYPRVLIYDNPNCVAVAFSHWIIDAQAARAYETLLRVTSLGWSRREDASPPPGPPTRIRVRRTTGFIAGGMSVLCAVDDEPGGMVVHTFRETAITAQGARLLEQALNITAAQWQRHGGQLPLEAVRKIASL